MVTDNSKTHINPADYFSPDAPMPQPSILAKMWYPVVGSLFGLIMSVGHNHYKKRPLISGVPRHLLGASLGLIFGIWADRYLDYRQAYKDEVIYNYVVTHPDHFPPVERKKFKDVFKPWVPVR